VLHCFCKPRNAPSLSKMTMDYSLRRSSSRYDSRYVLISLIAPLWVPSAHSLPYSGSTKLSSPRGIFKRP
jgi:hypothetical protein